MIYEINFRGCGKQENIEEEKANLIELTSSGRLPISSKNIIVIPIDETVNKTDLINETSKYADLTILGFHESNIKTKGVEIFNHYDKLGTILFVNTLKGKQIK